MGLLRSSPARPKREGTRENVPAPCTSVKYPRRRSGEGFEFNTGPASGVSGVAAAAWERGEESSGVVGSGKAW